MIGARCIHLNIPAAIFILFSVIFNGIRFSDTAINHMETPPKTEPLKNNTNTIVTIVKALNDISTCPIDLNCDQLPIQCINCNLNYSCIYGKELLVSCEIKPNVQCKGAKEFQRSMICRYCWQTEAWEHKCVYKDNCDSTHHYYSTNCSAQPDMLCLGNRTFKKRLRCNWTQGYNWSTALIISITLGGFGADRFYLGHWQEGIGKLFSFGGLGVWTLIDVILISLHYLGPADGSLYL